MPILTLITFIPLLGSILVLLIPKERESLIKRISVFVSLIPLALSIYVVLAYDRAMGGMQFADEAPWIPALGASYHLGVDGLSVPLIFLTTLLTTLSLYYSSFTITQPSGARRRTGHNTRPSSSSFTHWRAAC